MNPQRHRAYAAAAEFRVRLLSFQRRTEQVAARVGLTPERYLLLLLVQAGELDGRPLTITALCEPLQMTQSSVSHLVDGSLRAGLLEKTVDARDRRRQHLAVSARGLRALETTFDALGPDRAALADALAGTQISPS